MWLNGSRRPARTQPVVERIQRALAVLGFKLQIDEVFGRQTKEAVEEFQRRMGLTVDDVPGPRTLIALGLGNQSGQDLEFTASDQMMPPTFTNLLTVWLAHLPLRPTRF